MQIEIILDNVECKFKTLFSIIPPLEIDHIADLHYTARVQIQTTQPEDNKLDTMSQIS